VLAVLAIRSVGPFLSGVVVVVLVEEEVFVDAVDGERHRGGPEPRERPPEAVPPRKRSLAPPRLMSRPWVVLRLPGGSVERLQIEAR